MIIGNYVEATDSLQDVSIEYDMDMGRFGVKTLEVTKFNKYYFNNGMNLISFTSILFEDYVLHCLNKNKNFGIIKFLRNSVKNNNLLSNYFEKCKFDVIENRVIIIESKALSSDNIYEILGVINFDNHSFTVTYGGYFFIENLTDKNKQYFYYGD